MGCSPDADADLDLDTLPQYKASKTKKADKAGSIDAGGLVNLPARWPASCRPVRRRKCVRSTAPNVEPIYRFDWRTKLTAAQVRMRRRSATSLLACRTKTTAYGRR